ncbi:uncharacterized protein LDX57_011370 [Aspergillus melleus]|uniref:uncharacterized protein n=1 Tax=Aspergillus melleus TaxID=138277 RepID=UPI001E8DB3FD|nr:uncharacterized protein LDX57_011370 [Aspergillus melleus]KAH8433736.1 hypothetical protein LDX57_011370 [Aspergillus melleus]
MRQECSKLFWDSMPNVWYQIEPMDSVWDGKMKPLFYCPLFASRVTQVEIDVKISEAIWTPYNGKEFWERIEELFPSVKSVVLTCRDLSDLLFDTDWNTPHHSAAMRMVDPYASYAPSQQVAHGVLADLISSWQISWLISREQIELHWLMWETEKHFLENGALICPHLDCERWFRDGETWLVHVSKYCFGRVSLGQHRLPWRRNTAAEVKAMLDDRQHRINQMNKEFGTLMKALQLQPSILAKGRGRNWSIWDYLEDATIAQGYSLQEMELESSELWFWAFKVFCTDGFDFGVLNESNNADDFHGDKFFVRNISRRLTFR